MRFLIKTVFWLTLAFVVLPHTPLADLQRDVTTWAGAEPGGEPAVDPAKAAEQAKRTFTAAQQTLSDIGSLCERNPLICETGKAALTQAAKNVTAQSWSVPAVKDAVAKTEARQ
jgi:hypothetical protein